MDPSSRMLSRSLQPKSAVGCIMIFLVASHPAHAGDHDVISDTALLEYASRSYDKSEMMNKRVVLGLNHGVEIIATFPCSDLCPQYTVRVIRYDVPLSKCSEVGGVQKWLQVPQGVAVHDEPFCFPKILAENWDRYQR